MSEKIIDLRQKGLRLLQNPRFLGFTDDTARLAEFAVGCAPTARRVCELGSGSGGLAMLLWAQLGADCVGVEIMPANVALARRSLQLNAAVPGLGGHCRFICADWRNLAPLGLGQFDLVVSNPPFWPQTAGRLSPTLERRAATHEIFGGLGDMLAAARDLLLPGGTLCLLLPDERGQEACGLLQKMKLELLVQQNFARRVMISAKKLQE